MRQRWKPLGCGQVIMTWKGTDHRKEARQDLTMTFQNKPGNTHPDIKHMTRKNVEMCNCRPIWSILFILPRFTTQVTACHLSRKGSLTIQRPYLQHKPRISGQDWGIKSNQTKFLVEGRNFDTDLWSCVCFNGRTEIIPWALWLQRKFFASSQMLASTISVNQGCEEAR